MRASQKNRCNNPEVDPLLIGTGWAQDDLEKPQILLESTAGDSHPGSRHLKDLVEAAGNGVYKAGGKPAAYTISDMKAPGGRACLKCFGPPRFYTITRRWAARSPW